jgi:hypothetical protein
MLSRAARLMLSLIVLLACSELGPAGRVQAGFALGRLTQEPEPPKYSFGLEFELVVNGEGAEAAVPPATSAGMSGEAPIANESDHPRPPDLPPGVIPAHGGFQSRGASSGAGPSTGSGGGTGLYLVVPASAQVLAGEASGRLFLADERWKPPPFASRLFRPPR